ncbi:hypothetical protein [Curtobacterium sp. MCBD17_040]|uniref:hypothetical protein n=1 Tax=Curtobacterium sp. MCBD17_040 TaxID=2175674 RepID=UPI000DA87960|nr:hypothetical protein [Curtobacterium sp. MCBD17_040]WIB65918.1 hypothetical protein DEI94_17535 [Curtobacterium sp. MCBD17_040]
MNLPLDYDAFYNLAFAPEATASTPDVTDALQHAGDITAKRHSLRSAIEQLHADTENGDLTAAHVTARLAQILADDTAHTVHTSAGTDRHCSCSVRANHFEDDTAED